MSKEHDDQKSIRYSIDLEDIEIRDPLISRSSCQSPRPSLEHATGKIIREEIQISQERIRRLWDGILTSNKESFVEKEEKTNNTKER